MSGGAGRNETISEIVSPMLTKLEITAAIEGAELTLNSDGARNYAKLIKELSEACDNYYAREKQAMFLFWFFWAAGLLAGHKVLLMFWGW